ncbi:hypothetical protein QIT55_gp30 [Nitrosopumilus spindle-shaped virus]|uniref:Uncharacterized protein n=1 Tax=Nitrosopumilus spindle-shaped virus 1 TaxID=2848002 RepID=A0A514K310_9VIRU|nr:hypothetical protein QIT55_gp30 [Nitrosopumilus spindle-shaped virus]QDI74016.1 hypothetical protein [Nitrosopumilus spindle-shaped virus]
MWTCEKCFEKNNNNSRNCHTKSCPGKKPEKIIQQEQQETIRDFCPKCQSHQDFVKISKGKYKCTRCKRKFRMTGAPVPEIKKVLKDNTVISLDQ